MMAEFFMKFTIFVFGSVLLFLIFQTILFEIHVEKLLVEILKNLRME